MLAELDDHFFRHEYGQLVALLTRKVGIEHIHRVEDAVQLSLLKALETWPTNFPRVPRAWLYKVAYHAFIDDIRKQKVLEPFDGNGLEHESATDQSVLSDDDDMLYMIFICCASEIPKPSRLVLCLKVLCGFNVSEIAARLFISEANVHKRYQRARNILRTKAEQFNLQFLDINTISTERIDSVLDVLYVLFTEGYLSNSDDFAIRRDLCEEAGRLLLLLERSSLSNKPKAHALLALMSFNLARLNARQTTQGVLLLLEEQDRGLWDSELIRQGFAYLSLSAAGEQLSRYHLEAAIAAEHCRASSFVQTDWQKICQYYEQLESLSSSYYYRLNRVVALAEWQGAETALNLLLEHEPPLWMSQSYLWFSVAADLCMRSQQKEKAAAYFSLALQSAPSEPVKLLIARRYQQYEHLL